MRPHSPFPTRAKPLALAVLCAFASGPDLSVRAHPSGTQTWVVQTCDDEGSGSLREIVSTFAHSGDTIDMIGLACGTITLQAGAIDVAQEELFLLGPGAAKLAIDAGHASQAFVHTGQGTLLLNGLTLRNGKVQSTSADVRGGCVSSDGLVALHEARVTGCVAEVTGDHNATGGGIYAKSGFTATRSTISGNRAVAIGPANLKGFGVGGGVLTFGRAEFTETGLDDNTASGANGGFKGMAGGAWVFGGGRLLRSTVSGNTAGSVGGLLLVDTAYLDPIEIASSTVSGNRATDSVLGAGLYVGSTSQLTIKNSTITGNIERNAVDTAYGAGLALGTGTVPTTIVSSIIAGNALESATPIPSDLGSTGSTTTVGGHHTLIGAALIGVPADTLAQMPHLAPLADNGGPTRTHALLPGSAAIDAGDAAGAAHDQRGEGFPRVLGASADIGAYESAPDAIFEDGFEETCAGSCLLVRR